MLPLDSRFYLLMGNYGSGKTELSLALARAFRREATGRVALVDMDIVNPYFRSAEKRELLQSEGVEVFAPTFAMTSVDIPALPAEIQAVFQQDFARVVIDVGGDDTGAVALGRYAPLIAPIRAQMQALYVVNPFRPLSGTEEAIREMFELIEARARLRPDWLVNNANLQAQTEARDLIEAQKLLERVSAIIGVPVGMVAGEKRLLDELPDDMRAMYFAFTPLMRPDWMADGA